MCSADCTAATPEWLDFSSLRLICQLTYAMLTMFYCMLAFCRGMALRIASECRPMRNAPQLIGKNWDT